MKSKTLQIAALCALAFTLSICVLRAADTPAPAAGASPAAAAGASPAAGESKNEHGFSLLEQIKEGGIIMIPIALLSVATLYLIADGIVRTGRKRIVPMQHEEAVKNFFRAGDYVGAFSYCKGNPSPLTNVLRVGVGLLGEGKQIAEEGMLGELAKENGKLQTWISYLSVIGVCSPMVGLLGTVIGMIGAFKTLGAEGIGNPAALAANIGEVLTATASGLFIAIPAFMAFYFLRNRAASSMHVIQDTVNSL
ncbi:MAG TPA: MotA/TolQ/ExbB proton channel family protein, partial [Chthoniobacteraceae bacterium]|nr:MotA/TolQ/ExbB proton channel family protein [Chthoniobacteraceae bacterium]